jgi:hypothetical protein
VKIKKLNCEMARIMRKKYVTWISIFVMGVISLCGAMFASSSHVATMEITYIRLQGSATGGELILAQTSGRNPRFVAINTSPGESGQSVVGRLVEAFGATDPFNWKLSQDQTQVTASGGKLEGLVGPKGYYFLAGTEKGLGIPEPPLSLSCSYDSTKDQILLQWENPSGEYDSIFVLRRWSISPMFGLPIPGTSTSFALDMKECTWDANNADIWLIGFRDNTPSNAAAINLSGRSQDERFGIPFTGGVAPNWTTFAMGEANAVQFEQGIRERFVSKRGYSNSIEHPATKPFYQLIKITSPDAIGGVKRKFLGLAPGHTYRVSARLSTLEMDSDDGEWSVSLHATYNQPGGVDLTSEQLSGLAMLPDGSKGAEAGRIAFYGTELTTKGTWEERSTGKEWRGTAAPDIVLPLGSDTITVWLRCRGVGSFGIDWVKLEDLEKSK